MAHDRKPANPSAEGFGFANPNPGPEQAHGASEPTNQRSRMAPSWRVQGLSTEITAPLPVVREPFVFANTNAHERARSEPANLGLASVSAVTNARLVVPPESLAEITAPIPRVSVAANTNLTVRGCPRMSVWALLGFTADARLIAAGYVAVRKPGHPLTWTYEPAGQAARRQERRRYEHGLRMRSREFARRVDSFRLAVAPRLGLDWFAVDVRVPIEYDDKAARTGDVIVQRGDTRIREVSDPADMPEVRPVRLVLPDGFHPESKALVTGLVKEYFGGEWGSKFYLTSHPHFAEFSREREKPVPPATVAWRRSDDFYMVHIGHDGVEDVYIPLKTDAPHWGVSAGSGKGKTTTLLSPLQHARSHGALVDIMDLKEDSFDKAAATRKKNRFNVDVFQNVSGVRVHRDVRSAVSALAEFYVSIKSMRLAREAGYDMSTIPPRFLILDEFGSFVQSADSWWKFGLGQKGETPFRSWFHQILMQGRSKDHRVVVGTHDYQRTTFGNTGVRDLIGTKALIRDTSPPAFMMAFGQTTKRIKINENHPGRALLQLGVGTPVREVQLAYTSEDDCLEFLLSLPHGPGWFDRGEIAPWITPESIARSHEEMFVEPFLPGGEFATQREIEAGGSRGNLPPVLGAAPASGLRVALTESELREREDAEILTQREMLDRGYLMPLVREAEARQPGRSPEDLLKAALKAMRNDRDRGKFPESVGEGTKGKLYRVGDVREWERNRPNKMEFDTDFGDDSVDSDSGTRGA